VTPPPGSAAAPVGAHQPQPAPHTAGGGREPHGRSGVAGSGGMGLCCGTQPSGPHSAPSQQPISLILVNQRCFQGRWFGSSQNMKKVPGGAASHLRSQQTGCGWLLRLSPRVPATPPPTLPSGGVGRNPPEAEIPQPHRGHNARRERPTAPAARQRPSSALGAGASSPHENKNPSSNGTGHVLRRKDP